MHAAIAWEYGPLRERCLNAPIVRLFRIVMPDVRGFFQSPAKALPPCGCALLTGIDEGTALGLFCYVRT